MHGQRRAPGILDGYADEFDFSSQFPVRVMRHRVIAPASRALHWRASLGTKPVAERHGNEQFLTWERRDVVAENVEDDTPEWYDPWETLQVTEYATWHDVAAWADDLFRPDAASVAAVTQPGTVATTRTRDTPASGEA